MNPPFAGPRYLWQPAADLAVSGEDARTFLQGQFTNDLQKTGTGGSVYGLFLNQKGKTLADAFVIGTGQSEFRVVSYFSTADVIRERLEAYVIADDVTITDRTAESRAITVFGSGAPAVDGGRALIFPGRRSREPHWEIVTSGPEETQTDPGSAKNAISAAEMEWRRIDARIPAVPYDIGPGELPNEGGLEGEAISYTKGCYLGQEVMARLKSMGAVRRRLVRISGSGTPPARLSPLFQSQRKIGDVRTTASRGEHWIGLALISILYFSPATDVALSESGPAEIRVDLHD